MAHLNSRLHLPVFIHDRIFVFNGLQVYELLVFLSLTKPGGTGVSKDVFRVLHIFIVLIPPIPLVIDVIVGNGEIIQLMLLLLFLLLLWIEPSIASAENGGTTLTFGCLGAVFATLALVYIDLTVTSYLVVVAVSLTTIQSAQRSWNCRSLLRQGNTTRIFLLAVLVWPWFGRS